MKQSRYIKFTNSLVIKYIYYSIIYMKFLLFNFTIFLLLYNYEIAQHDSSV